MRKITPLFFIIPKTPGIRDLVYFIPRRLAVRFAETALPQLASPPSTASLRCRDLPLHFEIRKYHFAHFHNFKNAGDYGSRLF